MLGNKKKSITAAILGKVALSSAKAAADSRCMYCFHQPKQPAGIKKICKWVSWGTKENAVIYVGELICMTDFFEKNFSVHHSGLVYLFPLYWT